MKFIRVALWAFLAAATTTSGPASLLPGAFAKIRGGSAAEAAKFASLLSSMNHDELLAAYRDLSASLRATTAAGGEADPALGRLSRRLMHRAKSLHFVEEGMTPEEFEHLNELMDELDGLMTVLDGEGGGARGSNEEMAAVREKSKVINREIKDIRKRYKPTDPRRTQLSEAEMDRIQALRQRLREGVPDPNEARELREELDRLYLKHKPKRTATQRKEMDKKGRANRRNRDKLAWAEELPPHAVENINKLRERVKASTDRDVVRAYRKELDKYRDGSHPDLRK